ncbi:MAG: radical SAM protein, partial [Myxococcota bacterium]
MARDPAVLLISPGILRWADVDFGVPHLVSIGGYVAEHTGVRVEILDLNYEGGDVRDLERRLDALGPFLLIGVSAYSSFDLLRVRSLARFLRATFPGVPLVTGGYHASALPEDLLGSFDRVIPGEAELEMRTLVEQRLGGIDIEPGIAPQRVVPELDALPPYRWELLARYWPRATQIGRKLQIYLSRGCPYRCAFCMERAKSGYRWRAYSPERAVDELARLATFTDLSAWTINLADPLFGFRRRWRRAVLEGIVERDLLPMGFWTLTRSDDLDDEDIGLLGRARFAIGIGLESGSPTMLRIMQKGNRPERYLDAVLRLARLSQKHGLNWATNVIVGHPGETLQTAMETRAFLDELFLSGPSSHGWLSVDPFRLYPGSQVHEQQAFYEETYGTRFHHPTWWRGWYDGPFRAQHLD